MKKEENIFLEKLNAFENDMRQTIRYNYTFMTFHSILAENKKALELVNETPLFWNTVTEGLRTSFYMAICRIFDKRSDAHSIKDLFKFAKKNSSILFSKEALVARKREGSSSAEEWIDEYMRDVYIPTIHDFTEAGKCIDKYYNLFEQSGIKDVRNQQFAHTGKLSINHIQNALKDPKVRYATRLIVFLNFFFKCIWELYNNGKKPVMRPMKYSINGIRTAIFPKRQYKDTNELMVYETEKFVEMFSTVTKHEE